MKRLFLSAAFCALLTLGLQAAQSSSSQDSQLLPKTSASDVPRLIKHGGTLRDRSGAPRAGTVGILFAIYSEQQGGAALWQESQNVQLDANGRYSVLLGSSLEIPQDVFAANAARWLGVQVLADAEPEQARMLLVSVPYALKAQDADTLGGRPASSYVSSEMLADALGSATRGGPRKLAGEKAALDTGTLSSGTAIFVTSSLAVGGHSITAVYEGDPTYASSTSSPVAQTVTEKKRKGQVVSESAQVRAPRD